MTQGEVANPRDISVSVAPLRVHSCDALSRRKKQKAVHRFVWGFFFFAPLKPLQVLAQYPKNKTMPGNTSLGCHIGHRSNKLSVNMHLSCLIYKYTLRNRVYCIFEEGIDLVQQSFNLRFAFLSQWKSALLMLLSHHKWPFDFQSGMDWNTWPSGILRLGMSPTTMTLTTCQ